MNSHIFDKIRIPPLKERRNIPHRAGGARVPGGMICAHPRCTQKATHKAPKGRTQANAYFWFCLKHVREYNKDYNYFSGMDDSAISRFQKESTFGHRPTWTMSAGGKAQSAYGAPIYDPLDIMAARAHKLHQQQQSTQAQKRRPLLNVERKSLETLGFDAPVTKQDIKVRFKALVKKYHPDVNGGDRASENRLREIIQAYNYLKSTGLC